MNIEYFQKATFLTSASTVIECPPDNAREVAFVGRSNAGKSSAINTITHAKLAKTSKTPGRTQLINFFSLTDHQRLVDLPGYGYAKVAMSVKKHWQLHLSNYLEQRTNLVAIILVMDIRHPLTEFDRNILYFCQKTRLDVHILLTKADKLSFGQAKNSLLKIEKELSKHNNFSIQLFSAQTRQGLDEAREKIAQYLMLN